ncbi:unnamed protein product [Urochloa decumbens]|uniref:F-box domain-containing protein n=1 Tax=Urochloa decumbens TaxID=240449 RepID=A0ABC9BYE6_9POAL
MPPKVTKRWVPVHRPGEASSSDGHSEGGADLAVDRLSALPDALLHHIMSFMKAWDAARTCVLSRRWLDLWASAPCVDIRVGRRGGAPEDFDRFVYCLLLAREALAPVETLRLRSPGEDEDDFDNNDVRMWIRHAIRRNARVIQLFGHVNWPAQLEPVDFVSRHLKTLKLSYADVYDRFTRQLLSQCPCLEELELKRCLVESRNITSVTLKRFTVVKCIFNMNLLVGAANLLSVRCIAPVMWVPLFKNLGALVTGSVMIDDSSLPTQEFEKHQKDDDEFAPSSDDDDGNNSTYARSTSKYVPSFDDSDEYTSDDSDISDDFCEEYSDDIKDNHDYGNDINSDSDTYEYSEIANGYEDKQIGNCDDGLDCAKGSKYDGCSAKYVINDYEALGGQNLLHSLSNAQNLELLGHSGEVVLRRESISCPTFSNLKTLTLGEWCINTGADFDILILLLQHSPSLEKLYLHLEMNLDIQKALEIGIRSKGGSFACKYLSMVRIRCTKDDPRVHMLAQLFRCNGVPLEKIYVRRSGSFYLRNLKLERGIAIGELCESRAH